jgi:hypothetical protein
VPLSLSEANQHEEVKSPLENDHDEDEDELSELIINDEEDDDPKEE